MNQERKLGVGTDSGLGPAGPRRASSRDSKGQQDGQRSENRFYYEIPNATALIVKVVKAQLQLELRGAKSAADPGFPS